MSTSDLTFLQSLTAEQAALVAVGIKDCATIEDAEKVYASEVINRALSIREHLLNDASLAVRKQKKHNYQITKLWICNEQEGMQLAASEIKFTRQSVAEWFAGTGNFIEACRLDPKSAYQSASVPREILQKAARDADRIEEGNVTNRLNNGTYCMKVASEIYEEFYSNLRLDEVQPKKEYLLKVISERHPTLSENEVKSIYTVTRHSKIG